ncbi:unnamed protein product [Rhodiola kirilowii]
MEERLCAKDEVREEWSQTVGTTRGTVSTARPQARRTAGTARITIVHQGLRDERATKANARMRIESVW